MAISVKDIEVKKALGTWKPNAYLSNMCMAYFQQGEYAARELFPVCPVGLSSSYYYIFSKGDLARDNVQRKPAFGHVAPAIMGQTDGTYACKVDQVLVGIDKISALDYTRSGAPGSADPRRAKVKFVAEQMNLHQDLLFAENFFKAGVWKNEWEGAATANAAAKKFLKFDDSSCDPVGLFDGLINEVRRVGRRKPNKLALGVDVFAKLKLNHFIMERIKYTGTTANPAIVTEQVLAQLFGVEKVVVLDSTYNDAPVGTDENMKYICDSKSALLCYTTDTPQIDEPSAGYIFAWDMLGDGKYTATSQFEGSPADHTEFIEGLIATDMKKTSDDLAVFLKNCVD